MPGAASVMFETLQDFMTHTKGTAYVLGALVLFGFIGFWLFLTRREGDG